MHCNHIISYFHLLRVNCDFIVITFIGCKVKFINNDIVVSFPVYSTFFPVFMIIKKKLHKTQKRPYTQTR